MTRLTFVLPVMLAACAPLPPPTPENNFIACRDIARIEQDLSGSLTDQVNAKLDSRAIGCPRIL